MVEAAKRDQNRVPTLLVETNDSNRIPTPAICDPITGRVLVNSTVSGNISIAPLSSIYNGTKTVPTGTAQTIGTQAISSVTVKSLSTNSDIVYIGASGVTTSNGFELLAGESVSLDVDNLSDVYVISASASQVVRYIAV